MASEETISPPPDIRPEFIYLVSPYVETLSKLIPASTKRQNNKQQSQAAINRSKSTIETL